MSDLGRETVRRHYERITPVVEELADVDGHLTIGLNDYSGWYVRRDHDDHALLEKGYEQEARCATLAKDYDTVCGRIDRALYALTTYKSRDAFVDWAACTIEDGETKWMNNRPTPGYGDLRGVMAWGDIDLADELKPQRGDLDAATQETIEETLAAYIEEYARLYGDRDAVFALDSVGGSYVMGAPAATLPIADAFEDEDARQRVMEEFVDRSNDWLQEAQERVEERVDGAAEVIDPDWVNNCNRQYKAPLSLHTDHDAAVVPLDAEAPTYDLVPFDDVDEELIEETADWAADLTSTEYSDRAETLVQNLWPDEYEAHDSWEAALKTWVEEEREREQQEEQARQRARQRRRQRKEEMGGGVEGAPVTPFLTDLYDAVDAIDTADVVRKHACDAWDTGVDSSSKTEFDPSWRSSNSGSSCFVDHDSNTFGDPGDDGGGGGYAAKAMALGRGIISSADQDLTGEQWGQAVDALRDVGYDVPIWTPEKGSTRRDGEEYEQMPFWAVKKAAVALGVLPKDAFVTKETERGTYDGFPGAETYNHALAAIEDAGLEHGREYKTTDGTRPEYVVESENESTVDTIDCQCGNLAYHGRTSEGVSFYLCPDCDRSARVEAKDGQTQEIEWDREVDGAAERVLKQEHGKPLEKIVQDASSTVDAIDCQCGNLAYHSYRDNAEGIPPKFDHYLCPDCDRSAVVEVKGGEEQEPKWDQEVEGEGKERLERTHDKPLEEIIHGGSQGSEEDAPPTQEDGSGSQNGGVYAHSELDTERGGYGYWKTKDNGETYFVRVTNFTIDVESFFFKDGERLIEMTVVPGTGEEPYDITVPTKVFNDARRFRDHVVTGLTTTFDGGASDLNELRKLVGGQDAPIRTGTHHMGLHPDTGEFVTPNGVLTADGWIEDPETAYIEREIAAERAWGLSPDEHTEYDPEEVAEILELVPKSRISERFLPALGWVYSAPVRPHIQNWEGQFNTLHVTGETGAGKSSSLSVLWQLLGMNGEPMACDDTKFALLTSMASTNSIPMWFDEYKPGDMKDWEVDRFQNLMRSTTRGGVATRGNADKSTEEYELKAPLMISGEQSIQGPAEQRRSIQTRFRDTVKESGSTTKEAFANLTGMAYDAGGETREPEGYGLEQHALAYYRFVLRQDEKDLKELWLESRDAVRELLTRNGVTGVDDLPRQGVQTVHFGMTLYRRFAEEMAEEAGLSPEELELPTTERINDAMLYVAKQFGDDGSRKSHLDRFVELASRAATEDYLEEGKHFTFVKEGKPDEQLALKLSSVHDRVSKYVRDHGLEGEDLLNTAKDYRDRMSEEADDFESYVVTHSQKSPPLARCARIDTEMAEEQLEFSRLAFGAEAEIDDDKGTTSDDDNDGGPRPGQPKPVAISEVDPTNQDVASVIGKVEFGQYDGLNSKEGAPAWTATLSDDTGEARLVVWDEEDIPKMYNSTGLFEPDALNVKGAETGEYDGELQLVVGDGTTIDRAQLGAGKIGDETPDEGQGQLDASTEQKAEADGGQIRQNSDAGVSDDAEGADADARRLANYVDNRILTKQEIQAECVEEFDWEMKRTEDLIEKAMKEGLLSEPQEGKYRQV